MSNHYGSRDGEAGADEEQLLREVRGTLELCASGLSTVEVADRLGVDPDAVRRHVARTRELLGAGSKLEAVVQALRMGLIALPPLVRS